MFSSRIAVLHEESAQLVSGAAEKASTIPESLQGYHFSMADRTQSLIYAMSGVQTGHI